MINTLETSLSLELFRETLRIRMVEEAIAEKYKEQKMRCPVHLSIGQEAVAVGMCKALLHSDCLISNHRAHAHYLAKGGSLKAMIAEIYGKSTGCCWGRGGSMHLVDLSVGMIGSTPIVGSSIPVGVGIAFAAQMKRENNVTVIFFGEGATEEGVFSECLNFASLKNLPVLFVCENNFYSVYSPLDVRQPAGRSRSEIARAHGVFAQNGFGNDVEEVYQMSRYAVDSIRKGKGPVFLEFETYRHREHCGPNFDNDIGYRTEEEFLEWETKCPLKLFLKKSPIPESLLHSMRAQIEDEISRAFQFAHESPFPNFNHDSESPYA
jgi:TPP-dependent pyruvate/acetoin dehydrogenase alpha subunit